MISFNGKPGKTLLFCMLIPMLSFMFACDDGGNGGNDATDTGGDDTAGDTSADGTDGTDVPADTPADGNDLTDTPADTPADGDDTADSPADVPADGDDTADGPADVPGDAAEGTDVEGDGDAQEEEILEEAPRLVLVFTSSIIETMIEESHVDVDCEYRDVDGTLLTPPGDLEIYTTADDATVDGSRYSFDEIGEKEFVCSSSSLSLETIDSVVVAFEGMDRGAVRLASFVETSRRAFEAMMASADADDETAYADAIAGLRASFDEISTHYYTDYSFYVYHPYGWPTRGAMEADGLTTGPDDAAWAAALSDLASDLALLQTAWTSFNAYAMDSDNVDAIISLSADVKDTIDDLHGLAPSEIAFMESQGSLTTIVGTRLTPIVRMSSTKLADAFEHYGPGGEGGSRFSLVEMLVSLAINQILSTLPSYSSMLKDAGKAAASSAMMLIIQGLIDREWPAVPGGPEFDSVHGSSAGFLLPGNPWTAVGSSFNTELYRNMVVFVPPVVGIGYVDTIDSIFSACDGLLSDPNILKRVKKLKDIVGTLMQVLESDGYASEMIVLIPESVDAWGDPEFMQFGPCPTGVNTMFYPVVGILIPVNLDVGRGPSHSVNVLSG